MRIKRHKLPKVVLGLCLIGIVGFKDTGIFVKDFTAVDGDGSKQAFSKYENINLISANKENYLVEKNGVKFDIPQDTIIRTSQSSHKYKLTKNTTISNKPLQIGFKAYYVGDVFELLRYDEEYGYFKAADGSEGYLKLTYMEPIVEESLTYGISRVDKVLKNKNSYYTLIKGDTVAIKNFKDDKYIIVDEKDNEYSVPTSAIELRRARKTASRSEYSRRASSISKVVESAYTKLGKPYVYADTGKRGYDCSGLTYAIYLNELGIKLNRSSISQAKDGVQVDRKDLVPGDLLFFKTSSARIGHAGIYIGDGNMIHASSSQRKVMITNINESSYYNKRYVTARRIIK